MGFQLGDRVRFLYTYMEGLKVEHDYPFWEGEIMELLDDNWATVNLVYKNKSGGPMSYQNSMQNVKNLELIEPAKTIEDCM